MTAPIVNPLPPIRFATRPYLKFCRLLDEALTQLEARYPAHSRNLTISGRSKRLRRKPK